MAFKIDPDGEPSDEEAHAAFLKDYDRKYMAAYYSPDSPLAENLREFRRREGLNKKDVAELMGVTPRTYYAYELGTRSVPSDALIKLATMTRVDLNLLLMGRATETDHQSVRDAIDDMMKVMKLLGDDYPEMNMITRLSVARHAVTSDTGDWPRMHPEMIKASVHIVTGFQFNREDVPSPPNPDHYGDDMKQYEKDDADWMEMVFGKEENSNPPK